MVLVGEVKTAVGEMMERGGGSASSNGGVGDKVSDDGERIVVVL